MSTEPQSCKTCRFYGYGLCRYKPPTNDNWFPIVGPDDWCGKWESEAPTMQQHTSAWINPPLLPWPVWCPPNITFTRTVTITGTTQETKK